MPIALHPSANLAYVTNTDDKNQASFVKKLQGSGFKEVYQMSGGMAAWKQAGLPVHTIK